MNRYPLWINLLLIVSVALGIFYSIPNFFGEAPGIQITANKLTVKVDFKTVERIESVLKEAAIVPQKIILEGTNIKVRFKDVNQQFLAQKVLSEKFNIKQLINGVDEEDYVVALNPLPNTPDWMQKLKALPMSLGLDLRGGVYFLLQVDMKGAIAKKMDTLSITTRQRLREQNIKVSDVDRVDENVVITFSTEEAMFKAQQLVTQVVPELQFTPANNTGEFKLFGTLSEKAVREAKDNALEKNILILRNRVDQLGVSEPAITRQGQERIVVQLPGLQDPGRAKVILGRTATLELRLVSQFKDARYAEKFRTSEGRGGEIWLSKQVQLTGDNLINATAGYSSRDNIPAIHLTLDNTGARIFRNLTRDNIGKQMAIVLFERGVGTVITAPNIRSEIPNGQVEISGAMRLEEANDISLLLRAGSLAAPMEIIEERTIGPSLGKENIERGFNATLYGFLLVVFFMMIYYTLFGVFSSIALFFNLVLLIAALSLLQASLTLPGIAAIALTLGMAIDANVLINERIREELEAGHSPAMAIHHGYERAFAAVFDANITTLIAGIALLVFSSGPVRGFAIVHCLGILTSMFSSIVGSRAIVNLWYGRQKRIDHLSIG